MIRIRVTAYNGAPPPLPLLAEFTESGGNIGRAEGNALVLHDPARTISRTHASIAFRDGRYHIRNLGTAIPVYVNGQPLGNGGDAVIAAGDEIRIDGYTMAVLPGETSAPGPGNRVPFASATSKDDPLALFGGQSERGPFDDLLTPPPGTPQQNLARPEMKESAHSGPASIIPPDFDPFGERPLPQRPRAGHVPRPAGESQDVLDLGFGPSIPNQSIDDLFGLTPGKNSEPFAPDSPLATQHEHSDKGSVDPFVALGVTPEKKSSEGQVQRDDVLELHGSFRPPEAKPEAVMRAVLPRGAQTGEASETKPYGMVLSWENKESNQDSGEIKSVIIPSPRHDRRKTDRRRRGMQPDAALQAVPEAIVAAPSANVAPKPSAVAPGGSPLTPTPMPEHDELLRAFLDGAGVPDVSIPAGLTPQFMALLGHLLRESTQGTLDLLLARTLTKREVRAELTMIAPKENNPLKFSPTVEVALTHLLAPQGQGFLAPLQAMRDAHDDLRSHQFGFMAGMRAALAGVLERFDPTYLEGRLTQKTVVDALLPINRKAKLWDLFAERYKDISREAEEDFHVLFGKEFLRAYEAQIAKLEQDDKK
ncbi:type VI secretion system-associated FHA domain protein TagH [Nitrosospira briensis]|uniref:type VI secretion system-associated FHA domain protein TagH n=1 Tax=Nitrosospira briensis TaxID=35799 RepID=UPI0008DFABF0|nr:type VI secretion system-associated FHA domain protein TagH [Nitrosospira briensis]SFO11275.1 FHA domain protein [Nitrosospira briensis]